MAQRHSQKAPVHDAHELHALIEKLRSAWEKGQSTEITNMAQSLLVAFQTHIESEEGEDGWYSQVTNLQPRLIHQIQSLQRQHYRMLELLMEMMRAPGPAPEVCSLAAKFLDLITQHEKREDALIDEVFYRDGIGRSAGRGHDQPICTGRLR